MPTGPSAPQEPLDPTVLPGDPPSDYTPIPVPVTPRDFPTQDHKYIAYESTFVPKQFNQKDNILWGGNGRLTGLDVLYNIGADTLSVAVPGSLIVNGIVCYLVTPITPVDIGVSGQALALVASTNSEREADPVNWAVKFLADVTTSEAVIAYTSSLGTDWVNSDLLNIIDVAAAARKKQLTDREVQLLVAEGDLPRNGTIDDANTLHQHSLANMPRPCFEAITGLDGSVFPHVARASGPIDATAYHGHTNLLTDVELNDLTSRDGIQVADRQHTHKNLPTDAGFAAVFGGPTADASEFHTHGNLNQAHGIAVSNPRATLWDVPQNQGNRLATINATASTFSGSVALILGESSGGSGVNRVTGIRYRAYASTMFSTLTSNFGGNPTPGTAAAEVTELFGAANPHGVLGPVPFDQEFTWQGIRFKVITPAGTVRDFTLPVPPGDTTGDFFSAHGVVAGSTFNPLGTVRMHERLLSRVALRLTVVLDDRYNPPGFATFGYL